MQTMFLEPTKAAYLAGLIDGEGTIGVYGTQKCPRYFRCTVIVTNCDPVLMAWLRELGVGRIDVQRGRLAQHRPVSRWRVEKREDVRAVLRAVLPYLVVKRAQALLALDFFDTEVADRGEFRGLLSDLNRRGA